MNSQPAPDNQTWFQELTDSLLKHELTDHYRRLRRHPDAPITAVCTTCANTLGRFAGPTAPEDAARARTQHTCQRADDEGVNGRAAGYIVEVEYLFGGTDTFTVDADGTLARVHVSDTRTLTRLRGFRNTAALGDEIPFEVAVADPATVIGLRPVFDTTEDMPTTLRATVTNLREGQT